MICVPQYIVGSDIINWEYTILHMLTKRWMVYLYNMGF